MDVSLEKLVFLFNADEGNYGIYELVWEFGKYPEMEIDEKYKIAKELIREVVKEGLAFIQTYSDCNCNEKDKIIQQDELDMFLNNPANWHPNSLPLPCLEITQKGINFLEKQMEIRKNEIQKRLFGDRN